MLKQLFSSIYGILLFKKGPQDVPYSPGILGFLIALMVGAILLTAGRTAQAGMLFFDMVYIFIAFWFLLSQANKKQRYVQTMVAYVLCSGVMTVIAGLLLILIVYAAVGLGVMPALTPETMTAIVSQGLDKAHFPTGVKVALMIAMVGFLLWRFLITAHILRHALDATFQRAVFLVFIINLIPLVVHSLLK